MYRKNKISQTLNRRKLKLICVCQIFLRLTGSALLLKIIGKKLMDLMEKISVLIYINLLMLEFLGSKSSLKLLKNYICHLEKVKKYCIKITFYVVAQIQDVM